MAMTEVRRQQPSAPVVSNVLTLVVFWADVGVNVVAELVKQYLAEYGGSSRSQAQRPSR